MKFCILTLNPDQPGGGSELMWRRVALALAANGHTVHVAAAGLHDCDHPEVSAMRGACTSTLDLLSNPVSVAHRIWRRIAPSRFHSVAVDPIRTWLENQQPDLVFVSLGGFLANIPRLLHASIASFPYVVVSHGNRPDDWVSDEHLEAFRTFYLGAREAWFVSDAAVNFAGTALLANPQNWHVVRNPTLLPLDQRPLPFPPLAAGQPIRLAMPSRISYADKGHDVLMQALRLPEVRALPLRISVFGGGPNANHLHQWIEQDALTQIIELRGHAQDIAAIWEEHHLCLFCSRYEGLPIGLVEAMLCGRPAAVTDVGGCREAVDHGSSGFVVPEANPRAIAQALTEVCNQRERLPAMGAAAAERIRTIMPPDVAATLADKLEHIASEAIAR